MNHKKIFLNKVLKYLIEMYNFSSFEFLGQSLYENLPFGNNDSSYLIIPRFYIINDCFIFSGICSKIYPLMLVKVIISSKTPHTDIEASTVFIEKPKASTIVYATNAVSPKNGATAYGLLAIKAIRILPIKAISAVTVKVDPNSNPAFSNILGLNT